MFSKKKKKLSLEKMNDLYILLAHSLPEKDEELLIDEVSKMLEKLTDKHILDSLEIMYGEVEKKPGIYLGLLFIRGLRENNFFEYAVFVRGMNAIKQRSDKN